MYTKDKNARITIRVSEQEKKAAESIAENGDVSKMLRSAMHQELNKRLWKTVIKGQEVQGNYNELCELLRESGNIGNPFKLVKK